MTLEEKQLKHNTYMRGWKKRNSEKVNAINRAVKAKNPELYRLINLASYNKKFAEHPTKYYENRIKRQEVNPALHMCKRAKVRAKQRNLDFNLEPGDILVPELCPVFGCRLEWGWGKMGSSNYLSPSLDRHDPKQGYIKGNVKVISNRANHLKNDGTLAEFRALVAYLEAQE